MEWKDTADTNKYSKNTNVSIEYMVFGVSRTKWHWQVHPYPVNRRLGIINTRAMPIYVCKSKQIVTLKKRRKTHFIIRLFSCEIIYCAFLKQTIFSNRVNGNPLKNPCVYKHYSSLLIVNDILFQCQKNLEIFSVRNKKSGDAFKL